MVVGELANFAAYAFAPAIIVTPLGALSIIVSAVLAHSLLNEKLNVFGILGCLLCMEGSFAIVLQAPPERQVSTVREVCALTVCPVTVIKSVYSATCLGLAKMYRKSC